MCRLRRARWVNLGSGRGWARLPHAKSGAPRASRGSSRTSSRGAAGASGARASRGRPSRVDRTPRCTARPVGAWLEAAGPRTGPLRSNMHRRGCACVMMSVQALSAALLNGCRPLDGGCSAHCCRCRCSMTSGVVVEQLFAPDPVTTDGTCARMHHPHVGQSLRDSQPFIVPLSSITVCSK